MDRGGDPEGFARSQQRADLLGAGASDDAYDDESDFRRRAPSYADASEPAAVSSSPAGVSAAAAPLIDAPSPYRNAPPRSRIFDRRGTFGSMPVRNDRVRGQYFKTFKDRQKITGGGFGGFWNALLGRGMRRLNDARLAAASE